MPTIAERLNDLAATTPDRLDLVMVAIAGLAHDRPVEHRVVAELDRLAAAMGGARSAEAVVRYVFGDLAFLGDSRGYHRSANSYIHRVLVRRRGIPITLAAVAAEVGRRVGVDLPLVGLPGHVVLGDGSWPERWFDPFSGGAALDLAACRDLFGRFAPVDRFDPTMVRPMTTAAVATRMLNNLKVTYQRTGDLAQLARVLAVTSELEWSPVQERVDLVRVLVASGRDEDAARVSEQLVTLDPVRAPQHRAAVRRHLARRN